MTCSMVMCSRGFEVSSLCGSPRAGKSHQLPLYGTLSAASHCMGAWHHVGPSGPLTSGAAMPQPDLPLCGSRCTGKSHTDPSPCGGASHQTVSRGVPLLPRSLGTIWLPQRPPVLCDAKWQPRSGGFPLYGALRRTMRTLHCVVALGSPEAQPVPPTVWVVWHHEISHVPLTLWVASQPAPLCGVGGHLHGPQW